MESRKTVVVLTLLAVLMSACGSRGATDPLAGETMSDTETDAANASPASPADSPTETTPITIALQPAAGYTPMHVAERLGLFSDAGIELDVVGVQGAGPSLAAIEGGTAQTTIQTIPVLANARLQGSNMKMFCGNETTSPFVIMAAKGHAFPVATPDDWRSAVEAWEGSAIGVPSLGGGVEFLVKDVLSAAGMSPDSVELAAVGVGEAAMTALENGTVDLLFNFPFFTQQTQDRGEVVLSYAKDLPSGVGANVTGWIAPSDWLDQNAATAERFCQVMQTGIDEMPEHPDEVRKVLAEEYGLEEDAIELTLEEGGPLSAQSTSLSCDNVDVVLEKSVSAGIITGDISCQEVLWDGLLQ